MPGFWELESEREFSAAHKLNDYEGKCANMHGHNWRVVARIQVLNLRQNGLALDFGEIKAAIDAYDHKCLNDIPAIKAAGINTTAEELSRCLANDMEALCVTHGIGWRQIVIEVYETEKNKCSYIKHPEV